MKMSDVYEKLMDALNSGGTESVMKAVYDIFKMPVAASDASFKMLTPSYPFSPQGDDMWDDFMANGGLHLDGVQILDENEVIREVRARKKSPIYLNWGYFVGHERLTTAITARNEILGYLAVLCPPKKYRKWHDAAIEACAKAFGTAMLREKTMSSGMDAVKNAFVRDLIHGKIGGVQEIEKMERKYGLRVTGKLCIAEISSRGEKKLSPLEYVGKVIADNTKNAAVCVDEQCVDILLYGLSGAKDMLRCGKELVAAVQSLGFICSMSGLFSDKEKCRLYLEQASLAGRYGTNENCGVLLYDENIAECVIRAAGETVSGYNIIHGAVHALKRLDQENGTEYFKTLGTYLSCGKSPTDTCKKLGIHRNSLAYRLRKIEDAVSIDLSDPFLCAYLMMSFGFYDVLAGAGFEGK